MSTTHQLIYAAVARKVDNRAEISGVCGPEIEARSIGLDGEYAPGSKSAQRNPGCHRQEARLACVGKIQKNTYAPMCANMCVLDRQNFRYSIKGRTFL